MSIIGSASCNGDVAYIPNEDEAVPIQRREGKHLNETSHKLLTGYSWLVAGLMASRLVASS